MIIKKLHNTSFVLVLGLGLLSPVLISCGNKKKASGQDKQTAVKPPPERSPNSAELIYKNNFYEAIRLKTVGDLEESQKVLEFCLTKKPDDDAVLYLLASYAEGNRRFSKAREYIKKACSIDPNNIWYVEMLAKIQISTDDFTGAEKSFERLVAYDRYNREWLYYYSETLIFNRKYAEAVDVISSLIDEIGPIPDFVNQRNELLIELKRDQEMLSSLKKLILENPNMPEFTSMFLGYFNKKKELDLAERELLEIANNNPNHAAARIALADLYNIQGKQSKALDQLKIAFEANILDLDNSIQVMLSVLEKQEEIDPKVLELALILQEKQPNHFMSHVLVGEIYKQQGKKKEALAAYEKSLEINQDNFELWLEVVSMNYTMKRYTDALKKAEQALELFPSQPQIYYYAGMAALYTKSYQEALNFLETGKDNVVRDSGFKAQFELSMAEVHFAQNNIPKARKHLEAADFLAPNQKLVQNNRAYILAKYKVDLDKALTIIQQVIQGSEQDAIFLDTYAWVHFARKEYELALEKIKQAYHLAPENSEINEHYGDILYRLGRIDEALTYWIKAREFGDESAALSKKIQTKKLED